MTQSLPFYLTPEDLEVLSMTDEEYTPLSWEFIKDVIAKGAFAKLTRLPSQLRKYQAWSTKIREDYGSSTNFLLQERLHWKPLPAPSALSIFPTAGADTFAERSDYRILLNDWPYGVEPGIKHVCVWLKIPLETDEAGGLTERGAEVAGRFVRMAFDVPLGVDGQDKVLWFQNPTAFQSVRAVSHLHVFVRGVDDEALDRILEHPPLDYE